MITVMYSGLELLTLGLERGADVHWDLLHNLRTLDCLVYEVQNISVDLAKLETLETVYIMEMLGALNKLCKKDFK